MRRSSALSIMALCTVVAASEAEAKLDLYIDKSTQQISVIRNGALLYLWPVSTGRDRFSTPSGVYTPERLEPIWYSKAYYNAPMPHAIFFHHGYAIHGSYDIAQLGGPASHGCVRLHPQEAALLYAMVEQEGPGNTTIVVGGGSPNPLPPRYRDLDEPTRSPYLRDSVIPRGAYPPNAGMPAYDSYQDPNQYVDGPGRRRGDNSRLAMRETYPPNRPPAPPDAEAPLEPSPRLHGGYRPPVPRLDAEAPFEPPLPPRGSYRPPPPRLNAEAPFEPTPAPRGNYRLPAPRRDAEASIEPALGPRGSFRLPATAKPNSKCPTCSLNRASDEQPNRNVSANRRTKSLPPSLPSSSAPSSSAPSASSLPPSEPSASSSPPPVPPPASSQLPSAPSAPSTPTIQSSEQLQPSSGYKVLPRSYWAGASWRWRLKAEHEISVPTSDSP